MSDGRSNPKSGDGKQTPVYEAFIKCHVSLRRFVSRFLRNVQDIDDVTQEAFLRAYSAERSKPIEQPKSFLFRIARNVALTRLTQKSSQVTNYLADFDDSEVLLEENSAEDALIAQQTIGLHCEAVAELAPQCRRVYLMRKVYAMSHKEIAGRLGISLSTVDKHLTKGLAHCDRYVRERTDPAFDASQLKPQKSKRGQS